MADEASQLTVEEISALALRGLKDPVFFCGHFLSSWFPKRMPWVHRGILAIVLRRTEFLKTYGELDKIFSNFVYREDPNDPKSALLPIFIPGADGKILLKATQHILIMMPRGFSKTTLMNAATLIMIVYQIRRFPFYLSESGTHASNQLGNVKRELESNERLRAVFGNLVPNRQDSAKWTEDQIETTSGIYLLARGRGGQVRGSTINGRRPDQFIIDDVEDEESVQTPDQRAKVLKWLFESVIPAMSNMDPDASMVMLATLLHREAAAARLQLDPTWTTVVFGAEDRQGELLWAEMMDSKKLASKKNSFALVGNLAGFWREYYNRLTDDSTKKFKPEYIRVDYVGSNELVLKALACDPAIGKVKSNSKKKPDFFALACAGMTERGKIVVLEADGWVGLSVREQVDKYFEWHVRHGLTAADMHGIEAQAYQVALVHLVQEEMFRRKTYFEVQAITHGENKFLRVEGVLQPRYAAGYIVHARHFPLLEQQLDDWPNDKLDLPDVLAMAVTLLDPAAPSAGMEDGKDLGEDEYPPIARQVGGNWRHAP